MNEINSVPNIDHTSLFWITVIIGISDFFGHNVATSKFVWVVWCVLKILYRKLSKIQIVLFFLFFNAYDSFFVLIEFKNLCGMFTAQGKFHVWWNAFDQRLHCSNLVATYFLRLLKIAGIFCVIWKYKCQARARKVWSNR